MTTYSDMTPDGAAARAARLKAERDRADELTAIRAALVKKGVVTEQEIELEKPRRQQ